MVNLYSKLTLYGQYNDADKARYYFSPEPTKDSWIAEIESNNYYFNNFYRQIE